jgi:uncharacterized protein YjbJ (UPF0337 family)
VRLLHDHIQFVDHLVHLSPANEFLEISPLFFWISVKNVGEPREERKKMSTEDKFDGKADEVKGEVKETVGHVTDDKDLEAEGKGDKVKGNLKQAAEKVKDAFKD